MDVNAISAPLDASAEQTVVALDAGNSKTDIAVVTSSGEVIASVRTDGFSPAHQDASQALEILHSGVTSALRQADCPRAAVLVASLANADLEVEEKQYLQELSAWNLAESTIVNNDTFALLRSGSRASVGVAVVCGAGINCVGVGDAGQTVRFAALGALSGDWGGGQGMATEAMYVAARAEDGRGRPTALSAAIADHFGMASTLEVSAAFHLGVLERSRLHEVSPLLFTVAERGDDQACAIIGRQAEEIAAMAGVALRTLELSTDEVDVVLGGAILAAERPILMDDVRARILSIAPRASIRVPDVPPVAGAVLLALEELPLEPDQFEFAETRVRDFYVRAVPPVVVS